MIHPIPPGTRDVLPDEMRELRRLHLALIEVFESRGYGEVVDARDRVRRGAGPRRRAHRRRRLPLLRRARRPAGAALGHDGADRPPGRQPLRGRRAAAAALLPGQRLPGGAPAARPDARVRAGRGRADRRAGAAGDRRGRRGARGGARRRRPRPRRDRPRRRRPLPPAARRVRGRGRGARLDPRRGSRRTTWSGLEAELSAVEGIGEEQCATCVALSQLRGGSEVLEQARGLGGAAVERATARMQETFEALEAARRRRPGPDRPRPAARPRLLQRRHPRGLRPGAGPRARRRRPLRRAAEALRRRPAGGGLRPLPGARPRRPDGGGVASGRGGIDERRGRRPGPRPRPRGR